MENAETFSVAGLAAPHPLAAAAGRDVLIEGGGVIEAALAAAAVAAVVVADRNGLGGDALWLIREPGPRGRVRVLDARGAVAAAARLSFYRERELATVPLHGAEAVIVAPGIVAGWAEAHALSAAAGGRLPLSRLLAPAHAAARDGWIPSVADVAALAGAPPELSSQPGFAAADLAEGEVPAPVTRRSAPALAAVLERLIDAGLTDFYRGDVARELGADLDALSCPLGRADLRGAEARWRQPHTLDLGRDEFAVPPTRSGLRAAVALGLFAGLRAAGVDLARPDGVARWHGLIEASREGEAMLDAMEETGQDAAALLDGGTLARASLKLDRRRARSAVPPSEPPLREAAVWIGVVDRDGAAVSLVQTLGGAFGSGVVSGRTGILLGNRGAALAIDPDLGPVLRPGRRVPLRSLPALSANARDGRVVALGVEGDEAATVAAQLAERLMRGTMSGAALAAPRFALGATPDGREGAVLMEEDGEPGPIAALRSAGHQVVEGGGVDLRTAGIVVRLEAGRVAGASDRGEVGGV